MEQPKAKSSVSDLTLNAFIAKTNQQKPEITGGCVLLTTATLTTSMILMGLKISLKRTKEPDDKRFLKRKITALTASQQQMSEAADHDLEVFDLYRAILKSKSRTKDQKLNNALKKATDSLLEVCEVIQQSIVNTEESKSHVHHTVLSDLLAGNIILEAVFKGILALVKGNISGMPANEQQAYVHWMTVEEDLGS